MELSWLLCWDFISIFMNFDFSSSSSYFQGVPAICALSWTVVKAIVERELLYGEGGHEVSDTRSFIRKKTLILSPRALQGLFFLRWTELCGDWKHYSIYNQRVIITRIELFNYFDLLSFCRFNLNVHTCKNRVLIGYSKDLYV